MLVLRVRDNTGTFEVESGPDVASETLLLQGLNAESTVSGVRYAKCIADSAHPPARFPHGTSFQSRTQDFQLADNADFLLLRRLGPSILLHT